MNENFETLFENSKYSQNLKKGQIVKADVIDITSDHAILNAGLKSEAAVSISQFKDLEGEIEIKIGDTVEVSLEDIEDGEGQTKLSRQRAKNEATWNEIMKALEENSIINGFIKSRVKGGFTVLIGQINAFLPGSLVDIRPVRDTQYLEGTNSEFKVIKAEKKANNIVLSRKAAIQGDNIESKSELIEKINEGDVVEGIVKNLTDYGAFIDLGGIDGLLHITDISWKKIKHPSQQLSIADKLKVKVINAKTLSGKYDFIKIDAEGSEFDILSQFNDRDFKKTDFMIEISTATSRKNLWNMFNKKKLKVYAQKISWKRVAKIEELPTSHREGSVLISSSISI